MLEAGATFSDLLLFVLSGVIAGLIYNIFSLFKVVTKNNIIVTIVSDIVSSLLAGFVFIYSIFRFEYGEFAFFEVLSFLIGIAFEQIFVKNLFAKPVKWVYNKIKLGRRNKEKTKEIV